MIIKGKWGGFAVVFVALTVMFCGGCDFLYKILQKEGAEEKKLLGSIPAFEHNPVVEELQKLLSIYGYNPGALDGKMGLNTRNAVEKFQKDHGLKPTRFIDQTTWEQLNILKEAGLVLNGALDTGVLQRILKNANVYKGKIDGKIGPATKSAIREFQRKNNLKPDGVVGAKTLRKLLEYLPSD